MVSKSKQEWYNRSGKEVVFFANTVVCDVKEKKKKKSKIFFHGRLKGRPGGGPTLSQPHYDPAALAPPGHCPLSASCISLPGEHLYASVSRKPTTVYKGVFLVRRKRLNMAIPWDS